ncbi:hypothetical protein ACFYTQ_19910 [Nocardia sp. NPDC004068]|uniref:hypothetical protein n=1 Tax=Nocardia sp. NPDC004068 TaxID=3364303 RepID=UPI003693497B
MNWAERMEKIAADHATAIRSVRLRLEEIDDEARRAAAENSTEPNDPPARPNK